MNSARRTGAAAVSLAAAMLLAACGSGGARPAARSAGSATVNQINPVAYDQVKAGGTLLYPLDAKIVNFNELEADGTTLDTQHVMAAILPQMFTADAANQLSYDPDYLTGEPTLTTTGGHQTVTYELNPKAGWADGTPISAADFIGQWKADNGSDPSFTFASSTGYAAISDVAQGANPREVVVTFGQPYGDWKGLFSPLYPASTTTSATTFNSGWAAAPLTSAGPFLFASQDTRAQTYTLKPNPGWWGRAPKLDAIQYLVIDPAGQPAALSDGQIDLLDVGPDASRFAQVQGFGGVDIREAGGPNFRQITVNGSSPELTDVKTRQALAMGIDRDAIARTMLAPLGVTGDALTALDNHVYLKNQDGYRADNGDLAYDPQAAAALLTAEGWRVSGATRVNDGSVPATVASKGKILKINFVIPAGVAVSAAEAQLVQTQLRAIDVEVDIDPVDSGHFFDQYVTPGNFDFTAFSWVGGSFAISSAASIYANEVDGDWGQNYSRAGSAEIDAAFATAESDLDPAQAIRDADAADALVWRDVLSLTTYQRPDIWAVRSDLVNFGAYGFATPDYTAVGFSS